MFLNKVIWMVVCSTPFIPETGWNYCSTFIYFSDRWLFKLTLYIQWKIFIFWNSATKNHGQVSLYKKGYQYALLVSLTKTPPDITTATHIGEEISSLASNIRKVFAKKYGRHLVFLTVKFVMLEWNGGQWKPNNIFILVIRKTP